MIKKLQKKILPPAFDRGTIYDYVYFPDKNEWKHWMDLVDKEKILVNYKKEANEECKIPEEMSQHKMVLQSISSDSSQVEISDISEDEGLFDEEEQFSFFSYISQAF